MQNKSECKIYSPMGAPERGLLTANAVTSKSPAKDAASSVNGLEMLSSTMTIGKSNKNLRAVGTQKIATGTSRICEIVTRIQNLGLAMLSPKRHGALETVSTSTLTSANSTLQAPIAALSIVRSRAAGRSAILNFGASFRPLLRTAAVRASRVARSIIPEPNGSRWLMPTVASALSVVNRADCSVTISNRSLGAAMIPSTISSRCAAAAI